MDPRKYLRIGIVDDDAELARKLALLHPDTFADGNDVSQVLTQEDAAQLLERSPDVILVDGRISNDSTDGLGVMRDLRGHGYTGPFVAISDNPETRGQMEQAGAAAGCEKYDLALPDVVRRVVGGEAAASHTGRPGGQVS